MTPRSWTCVFAPLFATFFGQPATPTGDWQAVVGGTHGTGSTCVDALIADCVGRGSAKDLDVSCVDRIHLPRFVTK